MGEIQQITDSDFDDTVINSKTPVLVDFWAPWCSPCRAISPVLEEIAGEWADKLTLVKVNVDDNQATAQRFDILSIPTLLLFKGGEVKKKIIGGLPKERLLEEIQPHL